MVEINSIKFIQNTNEMHTSLTPPAFVIPLNKQIDCFEISPYESSTNFFCAVLQNKIVLGLFRFPVSSKLPIDAKYTTILIVY